MLQAEDEFARPAHTPHHRRRYQLAPVQLHSFVAGWFSVWRDEEEAGEVRSRSSTRY